jgi:hypothetical protein
VTAIAWLGVAGCVAFTLIVDACLDPDRRAALGLKARSLGGGYRANRTVNPKKVQPPSSPSGVVAPTPRRPYISPPAMPTDYSDLRALIARSLPDSPPPATEPRARRD